GFIGSHIASVLLESGHEVRGLDSLTPAVHNGRPSHVLGDLVVGDVRDPAAVDEALAGVDAVCHQAAMVGLGVDLSDLPLYADVNVTGTAVLLEAMGRHGIGRLVFASSMVVYGEGAYDCAGHGRVRPLPRDPGDLDAGLFEPRCPACGSSLVTATVGEEAPLDPRNAYAASKVAQEHLSASWARLTGGVAVGLRYHNVYGPRMPRDTPYSGVAAIFRSCLENGVPPRRRQAHRGLARGRGAGPRLPGADAVRCWHRRVRQGSAAGARPGPGLSARVFSSPDLAVRV